MDAGAPVDVGGYSLVSSSAFMLVSTYKGIRDAKKPRV